VHLPGPEPQVGGITHDSRRVEPGWMFCCVPGQRVDGHDHAADAVAAGAVALLCERRLDLPVAQVVVDDVRWAMGRAAAAVHGHPADRLVLVGITGTNGKTTTAHLLTSILTSAGRRAVVSGTLTGAYTTPESTDLQARLAELAASGTECVVMEVSSHALALHRVEGAHFRVSVFTNLGRDHLDFHGTEERYFAAKARLFTPDLTDLAVVNGDDVHGRLLADSVEVPVVRFSTADLVDVEIDPLHHAYTWRGRRVRVGLGGGFNVSNSLAAATAAAALGLDVDSIVAGLASAPAVPGRLEPVDAGQGFAVLVDYAHTPDGLRQAIEAVTPAAAGHRVIVVFGCGGDRDREKRPHMGAAAAELADLVIVTSDNPRSEDPDEIIAAIVAGVPAEYRHRVSTDPDRRSAILSALRAARPGDVVLVAGKGHETTQTIGSTVLPFDDRAVARELLEHLT
jgi:UDP-N-acetylmuramoyl-L-alanyl-D-glutamate--2,6-diaminopimelate ligase